MENSYGIGVANRYALFLDDESDPLETLVQKEQEKELKKKSKVAEKENKTKPEPAKGKSAPTIPKKTIKDTTSNKAQENKREDFKPNQRANTEGKTEQRPFTKFNSTENREERNNRRNREDRPFNGPSENRDRENRPRRENTDFDNRTRGERGERKEGRPVVGNRTGPPRPSGGPKKPFEDRRGKREFDRQSGSDKTHGYRGVKPVEKRDGAGAHNWGSTKDIIDAEADRSNNETDQSWGESEKPEVSNDTEKKEEPEVEQPLAEEEPKELTLDEWKAQRAGRVKPVFNIRKAGEGEDPSQWKKMFELKKKEKDDQESDDEEYDALEYPQRVGRQKHILDIDIQFYDNKRAGGGRGRGQGRGGRGGRGIRGPPREGEKRFRDEQVEDKNLPRAPKVDDERDFPSLG